MALGGLALAGGWLSPFIGQVFAWLAWPLLAYTLKIVEAIGAFPGLVVYVRAGWGFAAAYYASWHFSLPFIRAWAIGSHASGRWRSCSSLG